MTSASKALVPLAIAVLAAAWYGWSQHRTRRAEAAQLAHSERRALELEALIARLRATMAADAEALQAAQTESGEIDPWAEALVRRQFSRVTAMRQRFDRHPDQRIPEMRLLEADDWMAAAARPLETEEDFRRAMAQVRYSAVKRFLPTLRDALQGFEKARPGGRLAALDELQPYFQLPIEPQVLDRYQVRPTQVAGHDFVDEKISAMPDRDYDTIVGLSVSSSSYGAAIDQTAVRSALQAYHAAHPLQPNPAPEEVANYFTDSGVAQDFIRISRSHPGPMPP
ncbi:MAG TPA: hypothetical protein VHV47_11575 [Opitutaceae bacterium]|jgi:hypothetical protein|nr:hypothetical protein [Opitutaceae bacterium]